MPAWTNGFLVSFSNICIKCVFICVCVCVCVCSCPKDMPALFQSMRWTKSCQKEAHSSSTWTRSDTVPLFCYIRPPFPFFSAMFFLSFALCVFTGVTHTNRRDLIQDPSEAQSGRLTASYCVRLWVLWPWVSETCVLPQLVLNFLFEYSANIFCN